MFRYVTTLEALFLLAALIGTGMSIWGVATNAKDAKVMLIKRHGFPLPLIVSTLNRLYQVAFRLAINAVSLVVAGMAVALPPPPPDYGELPQVLASTTGWLVVACLLIVKEALDRRERRDLERYYDDQQPRHPHRRLTDAILGGE